MLQSGEQVNYFLYSILNLLGKALRHLQASLIICDTDLIIEMDGTGVVLEIEDGVIGIGSGGLYAECRILII